MLDWHSCQICYPLGMKLLLLLLLLLLQTESRQSVLKSPFYMPNVISEKSLGFFM